MARSEHAKGQPGRKSLLNRPFLLIPAGFEPVTPALGIRSSGTLARSGSAQTAAYNRSMPQLFVVVDVSVGCHRNNCGRGQISRGSPGRSAQFHQTCRLAHLHSDRQVRRPSSSCLQSTRPPDFKGWLHSGHAGVSLVMHRTLTRAHTPRDITNVITQVLPPPRAAELSPGGCAQRGRSPYRGCVLPERAAPSLSAWQ